MATLEVVLTGEYIVVGDYGGRGGWHAQTLNYSGFAWVWELSNNTWIYKQELIPSDTSHFDYSGTSGPYYGKNCLVDGNYALVKGGDNNAYSVFTLSNDIFVWTQTIISSDASEIHD